MVEVRGRRSFVRWMLFLCPVVIALYFGLWPELEAIRDPKIPGEIVFKNERPLLRSQLGADSEGQASWAGTEGNTGWSMDWLYDRFDDAMAWEHNPWKRNPHIFGSHYLQLQGSTDPKDQARVLEIRRLGELLHQRVLERYPELAVPDRNLTPDENGFLRWLEFSEKFEADPSRPGDGFGKGIKFPDELTKHLSGDGPWDAAAMKAWLVKEKPLLDEVRAIGLIEDRSIAGIDLERWHFMSARLAKSCSEALLLDARLSVEEGDVPRALESVRSARGIAEHLGRVETPTLLNATVDLLVQRKVQDYTVSEIIPAVPSDQFDAAAWEDAVAPTLRPPSELGALMIGEWNVTSRWWIMPMLSNADDPKYPSDPDALIDFHATRSVEFADSHSGQSPTDWNSEGAAHYPADASHLSRESRQLMEMMFIGDKAWSQGFQRSVHASAMTQAAFEIMKGQPIPNDPVYGLPYQWDPESRVLSSPDAPEFRDWSIDPIEVRSMGTR